MSSELDRQRFNKRILNQVQMSVIASVAITLAATSPCRAIDYAAGDWIPFAPGTDVLLGYAQFATRSKLDNTVVGNVPDSHLDSELGVARVIHYDEFLGHAIALQAILPFGSLNNAKIDGKTLSDTSGVADPTFATGMWLINDPKEQRYFSFLDFVSVPIGSYDKKSALNLGSHRWQNDFEVDYTQGFSNGFMVDMATGWFHAWDNHAAGTGHQRLQQNDTFGTYLWLSYDVTSALRRSIMPSAIQASVSVGYAGIYGGGQRLDGVRTGEEAGEQEIRVGYSQFLTPTWQGLITVSHDLNATGQYKQDVAVTLRVATLL